MRFVCVVFNEVVAVVAAQGRVVAAEQFHSVGFQSRVAVRNHNNGVNARHDARFGESVVYNVKGLVFRHSVDKVIVAYAATDGGFFAAVGYRVNACPAENRAFFAAVFDIIIVVAAVA